MKEFIRICGVRTWVIDENPFNKESVLCELTEKQIEFIKEANKNYDKAQYILTEAYGKGTRYIKSENQCLLVGDNYELKGE